MEEVNKLYPFIIMLVAVGMIIGVGILTLDKFGAVVYYTREDFNDTIAFADIDNTTHDALAYGNITVSAVWNGTGVILGSTCYQINTTEGHFQYRNISTSCDLQGAAVYVIYDFKEYATATRDAVGDINIEIAKIASDWLGLIVTVVILSIILFLVIRSFGSGLQER